MELQKNIEEFKKLETKIILVGYGNPLSHKVWLESINNRYNIHITIPIIHDNLNEIARKFGMITNNIINNKVIIIGKDRKIKAIQEYQSNIPRNVYEILRILIQLGYNS